MTNARYLLVMAGVLLALTHAFGASYQISTNAKGEQALDRAVAPGGSHEGSTKQQVLQGFVNADLQSLFNEQGAADTHESKRKADVSTTTQEAKALLDTGIDPPVITDIPNQTHNVGQSPTIPIVATDPKDNLPLTIKVQGLPPGMQLSYTAQGNPQISGKLTTAGSFTTEVRAYKFSNIFAADTFLWTVNP